MKDIGIIGAGVAALHLGLYLRQHGVEVSVYTNKTAEEVAEGPLLNSVSHHHVTVEREARLGVDHWPEDEYKYFCHDHYLGGDQPQFFRGDFTAPSRAIDYRVYLPRLMRDLEERGGRFVYRNMTVPDIEDLTNVHDLVVVSTGKGDIAGLFPRRADKSPYTRPMRKLAVGLWHGVRRREPNSVEMSIAPGAGELLAIPMYSFGGHVMALLCENVPGGDLEVLTDQKYADDPEAYRRLMLDKLAQHHPTVFSRIDPDQFRLQGPKDILQGAVVPVLREDYVRLPNGKFLLALGDVHSTVDPVVGQGANSASYSAEVVGQCIVDDDVYDARFCEKVAHRRATRVEATTDWVNEMVALPPAPHLQQFLGALATHRSLCDEFTENFSHPDRQMDLIATPERVAAAIARHSVLTPTA
jgi:2-polyprenyl-6-methoxyphenol hydroxylase-like FAD-dependent oxidoreductase